MTATLRIGTSGYSFPDWVGIVYPDGTRPSDMLRTYALDFAAVEINFTYYRDPSPGIFEGMLRKVDAAFEFVVKAPRGLTHERGKAAAMAPSFVASLEPLSDAGQLGGVLVQFPQAFHADDAGFDHLKRVADIFVPQGIKTSIEFRHNSWNSEPVYELLRQLGLGFVNVDLPHIGALPGPTNVTTNDVAYYRLHGRNAANWHNAPTGSHRYDYFYDDAELEEWAQRIEVAANDVWKVYVFANNCHKGSSFVNALRLKQRFDQAVRSDAEVAGTLFASSDPDQRVADLTRRVAAARAHDPIG
jgi:uncharacterized protein YecE (DUF72 family)